MSAQDKAPLYHAKRELVAAQRAIKRMVRIPANVNTHTG